MSDAWLFVHVPRTGGGTIRTQIGRDRQWPHDEHLPLQAYNRNGARVFTICRNPYDRAVSLAAMWWSSVNAENHEQTLPVGVFKQWVEDGMPSRMLNMHTEHPMKLGAPQTMFVHAGDCNWVGRFEDYAGVVAGVEVITGKLLKDSSFVAGSSTKHAPWKNYYRDGSVRMAVAAMYEQDFVEHGYEF